MTVSVGIIVFIVVVVFNVLGLSLDLVFILAGIQTITDRVRGGAYWMGYIIVAWQVLGVVGITEHFFFGVLWDAAKRSLRL